MHALHVYSCIPIGSKLLCHALQKHLQYIKKMSLEYVGIMHRIELLLCNISTKENI